VMNRQLIPQSFAISLIKHSFTLLIIQFFAILTCQLVYSNPE
jgi:hypothetical protein